MSPWKPNVFLINLGIYDAAQNYKLSTAGDRMELMLKDLWSMSPLATVILSTLLLNMNSARERKVKSVNRQCR